MRRFDPDPRLQLFNCRLGVAKAMSDQTPDAGMKSQNSKLETTTQGPWLLGFTSLMFILLQSACSAVMAISGIRVLIGLGSLAAAAGLNRAASGFHADAIRIPMMIVAVAGSAINLYVIWRIRSLRARSSSQWRMKPVTVAQNRSEMLQVALALVTLLLVVSEYLTHRIVHNV